MKLSIEAVLEIAQKIERNAAGYYEQAAKLFPDFAEDLLKIKVMEEVHETTFLRMQNQLDENQRSQFLSDPFGEMDTYLQAFADTSGGEGRPAEIKLLAGNETFSAVIERAIELEKETIEFYQGLDKLIGDEDKGYLKIMVDEESNHIMTLNKLLGSKK